MKNKKMFLKEVTLDHQIVPNYKEQLEDTYYFFQTDEYLEFIKSFQKYKTLNLDKSLNVKQGNYLYFKIKASSRSSKKRINVRCPGFTLTAKMMSLLKQSSLSDYEIMITCSKHIIPTSSLLHLLLAKGASLNSKAPGHYKNLICIKEFQLSLYHSIQFFVHV